MNDQDPDDGEMTEGAIWEHSLRTRSQAWQWMKDF